MSQKSPRLQTNEIYSLIQFVDESLRYAYPSKNNGHANESLGFLRGECAPDNGRKSTGKVISKEILSFCPNVQ